MHDGAGCAHIAAAWCGVRAPKAAGLQAQSLTHFIITRHLATLTFHPPKHETVRSCPGCQAQLSSGTPQLPPSSAGLSMLPAANDAQPCVSHSGPTLRGCAPRKTFQPFMTHTHHASARLKLASRLPSYSASLGCTNDPHLSRNLGVPLCPHWVDDKVNDDADVCCICSRPSLTLPPVQTQLSMQPAV